jgi:hypothetical protein
MSLSAVINLASRSGVIVSSAIGIGPRTSLRKSFFAPSAASVVSAARLNFQSGSTPSRGITVSMPSSRKPPTPKRTVDLHVRPIHQSLHISRFLHHRNLRVEFADLPREKVDVPPRSKRENLSMEFLQLPDPGRPIDSAIENENGKQVWTHFDLPRDRAEFEPMV